MNDQISVPIDIDIYNEFILRSGKSVNVAGWIENIVADYLERTEGEGKMGERKEHRVNF